MILCPVLQVPINFSVGMYNLFCYIYKKSCRTNSRQCIYNSLESKKFIYPHSIIGNLWPASQNIGLDHVECLSFSKIRELLLKYGFTSELVKNIYEKKNNIEYHQPISHIQLFTADF